MPRPQETLDALIVLVRTHRAPHDVVVVPVRWWTEGDFICLVYEAPPGPGLFGLRRRVAPTNPLTDETPDVDPRGAADWAYDVAIPDLWNWPHPQHPFDLAAQGIIDWRGDLRDGLPVRLPTTLAL